MKHEKYAIEGYDYTQGRKVEIFKISLMMASVFITKETTILKVCIAYITDMNIITYERNRFKSKKNEWEFFGYLHKYFY